MLTLDKARAHAGMELIPGNLATAMGRCGQSTCHSAIVPRVERSLMATMSGVVRVDRMVFGEAAADDVRTPVHVDQLGRSAADTHLRQLCALCHLGAAKVALGPNDEGTRGGGCNACHLVYSLAALEALRAYERRKPGGAAQPPAVHPALSLDIGNGQCFACHSRSGRIATSYEGWHELHEAPAQAPPPRYRTIEGDRVFERATPDIHHERGLDCIDCHTSTEVMGDGATHARKSEQLRVACADCHAPAGGSLPTVPASTSTRSRGNPRPARVARASREPPWPDGKRRGAGQRGDRPGGQARPGAKANRGTARAQARRPGLHAGPGAREAVVRQLPTAWAPSCTTCHTSFDASGTGYDWLAGAEVRGEWNEAAGPFVAQPPTLGVRRLEQSGGARRDTIETFVPGMILTIDRPAQDGRPAGTLFRRLYARLEPHTTRREARSCRSCHNDPVALGYGRGELRFERAGRAGRWRFSPASPPLPADGLPADAWIGFLGTREGLVATRDDVRPFSVEEQRRILRVGACLTCHDERSAVMRESLRDFDAVLARRSPRCLLPAWN